LALAQRHSFSADPVWPCRAPAIWPARPRWVPRPGLTQVSRVAEVT